jgi:hypothetical protein
VEAADEGEVEGGCGGEGGVLEVVGEEDCVALQEVSGLVFSEGFEEEVIRTICPRCGRCSKRLLQRPVVVRCRHLQCEH